jgi:integrase
LRAAEAGPMVEGMSGEDRFIFYVLAAWTGFRKGELGSVTLRHFKLDGEYPTLTISASYSKRRREDVQFLHPDVVSFFQTWIAKKNPKPDEILFPVSARTCGTERKTAKMVERDLASAREVWINESNSIEEREFRESSDYLKYVDTHGKFADFHGLRHTFITNLSRGHVAPKTAQLLARHSDMKLTMQIYTHVAPVEQAAAIKALPSLGNLKKAE